MKIIAFISALLSVSLLSNPVIGHDFNIDGYYHGSQSFALIVIQEDAQSDEGAQSDEAAAPLSIPFDWQDNANSDSERLARENFVADTNKILLNREECIPKAGEIIVCADKDVNTRYRIENRRSVRDLPRSHRSWVDGVDRLQDNAERNRLGSYSSNGYFGGRSQGIKNIRDYCEQGLSQAKDKNAQARAIADISQNQTSAPPKRVKGPCQP